MLAYLDNGSVVVVVVVVVGCSLIWRYTINR